MNNYLESIEEVRKWLQKATPPVDQFIYLLLDNGYDDLDAISRATDGTVVLLQLTFLCTLPTNVQHGLEQWVVHSSCCAQLSSLACMD